LLEASLFCKFERRLECLKQQHSSSQADGGQERQDNFIRKFQSLARTKLGPGGWSRTNNTRISPPLCGISATYLPLPSAFSAVPTASSGWPIQRASSFSFCQLAYPR
jgi:hypothetical protein